MNEHGQKMDGITMILLAAAFVLMTTAAVISNGPLFWIGVFVGVCACFRKDD